MFFCIRTDVRVREGEPPVGRHEAVQGLKSQVQALVPCDFFVSVGHQQLVVQQRLAQWLLQLRSFFDKKKKKKEGQPGVNSARKVPFLTNLNGCFISVATPPHSYSEKEEVSPMLKE